MERAPNSRRWQPTAWVLLVVEPHISPAMVRLGAERTSRYARALLGTRTDRGLVGKDVPGSARSAS
jgi:hypothetical protein